MKNTGTTKTNRNCGYCNVNMNKTTYAEVQNASFLSTPSIQRNKHTHISFLDHDHIFGRSAFSGAEHSVAVVVQKHRETFLKSLNTEKENVQGDSAI